MRNNLPEHIIIVVVIVADVKEYLKAFNIVETNGYILMRKASKNAIDMYIYIHMTMHTYTYIFIFMLNRIYIYIYIYIYMCMYVYIYIYI